VAKAFAWMKNGLAFLGILALGFWLGSGRAVRASDYDSGHGVQFQLTGGVQPTSALLVYDPGKKTVFLYQGAMQGNAALQCNYMFQMDHPGEVIRRVPCSMQKMFP
jgi:hypothetical protein